MAGFMTSNCCTRYAEQVSFSIGSGSRLPGGRHLTILVINTSFLDRFIVANNLSRYFPAAPTKGTPCKSSFLPGPSPINTISESGLPAPGTVLVLVENN